MLSDVSSLTEISSDDESYVLVSKAKKPAGKQKKEWQPKQVLKAPRLTQYSTVTLYGEILNGKVDLDPEYQRDVVWPDAKQSGLIDSIIRNFYIPPVIFAFSQTEDGEERRTCIDGKQRLTSVQRFMDGQIPFKDSRTNLKLWYKIQPWNEKGKLLPAQYRKQFDLKQIGCVEYTDLNEDSEREIFQRVQLGVALTPAERMHAISGPWPQLIRDTLYELDEYKISDALEWSKTRGRDFQAITTIIYLLEKKSAVYPGVSTLERWLRRVTPPTKPFRERVGNVFTVFRHLVLSKEFSKVFRRPTHVSPIEFVMIVVLISIHHEKHTLPQLAEGIRLMRKDVRSKHDDIRANTKVTKTLLGFINDRWSSSVKEEPGEKKALRECKTKPLPKPTEKGKRKRGDNFASDSSESSEFERPLKSKTKAVANSNPPLPLKPMPQTNTPVSRDATAKSSLKPESSTRTNSESTASSEGRTAPKPGRLDQLRRAKERVGLSPVPRFQEPTPPPTGGSTPTSRLTPVLRAPSVSQDLSVNNPNQVHLPHMWPAQFNPQMGMVSQQGQGPSFSPQFFQPNMPPQGQGPVSQMMPPPSNPNSTSPFGGVGRSDPRLDPYRSESSAPNLQGARNGWPSPNEPHHNAHANSSNQRGPSIPSASGVSSGVQGRDSRFDRSGGYRSDAPRPSPTESRGRGQGSSAMRGPPPYSSSSDRDREVLGSHSGGINGRDRDRDRNYSGNWSSRNGR